MTLTYEQTLEDVVELKMFNESEQKINVKTRHRAFLIIVLVALAVIGYAIYKDPSKADPQNLIWAVAVFVFVGIFRSPKIYRYRVKSAISKGEENKLTGNRTLSLLEEGIIVNSGNSESAINWDRFTMMKETKSYFFLYTSATHALIIPKRIFLLNQELYDAKSFIERKLTQQKVH